MGTARVSSLQAATSNDTRGKKTVLNRTSTSKVSLVDMLAYGCDASAELVHDHSRNTSAHSIQTRENETCFEMPWARGNYNPIVGDQPCIPSIQIQRIRTGGHTKIRIPEIICPFDGPCDNRQSGERYAPNQYNSRWASQTHHLLSEVEKECVLPTSKEEGTVQALQDASDLSQDASHKIVQRSEKDTMNSTLQSLPPNQGYQQQQQQQHSMWVDNKSRPKSKAIAIKRNNRYPEECSASLSEASSERMYDWATWRMYNRIVDHRRNQRQTTRTSLPPLAMDNHANQLLPHPDMHADRFESRGAADYIHEGEVFELDF